jgi:hypothetical protein
VKFANANGETEQKIREQLKGDFVFHDSELIFNSEDVQSDLPKVITQCTGLGLELSQIDIQKVNLETIFLKLTGKQLRD